MSVPVSHKIGFGTSDVIVLLASHDNKTFVTTSKKILTFSRQEKTPMGFGEPSLIGKKRKDV